MIFVAIMVALQLKTLDIVYSGSACATFWNDTACLGVNGASMHRLALVKRLSIIWIELIRHTSCVACVDKRLLFAFRTKSSLSC